MYSVCKGIPWQHCNTQCCSYIYMVNPIHTELLLMKINLWTHWYCLVRSQSRYEHTHAHKYAQPKRLWTDHNCSSTRWCASLSRPWDRTWGSMTVSTRSRINYQQQYTHMSLGRGCSDTSLILAKICLISVWYDKKESSFLVVIFQQKHVFMWIILQLNIVQWFRRKGKKKKEKEHVSEVGDCNDDYVIFYLTLICPILQI